MKKLKQDKVKRGRIILSAVLTMLTAIISLGFGAYCGYVTLNINYITIGTMTPAVGGLLVVAGFFIFFGCVGGVIALKEIFISSRNEEKFSAYKPALISAMVYYVIVGIISIIGIIVALISFIPSSYTWSIVGLAVVSLLLCGGSFYLVLKEMKEHKKKSAKQASQSSEQTQQNSAQGNATAFANMNLTASDIHDLSNARPKQGTGVTEQEYEDFLKYLHQNRSDYQNASRNNNDNQPLNARRLYEKYLEGSGEDKEIDFVSLAEKLMQLEELRKAGLINDQEYQTLKKKCIN